jgi:hypothetical protein
MSLHFQSNPSSRGFRLGVMHAFVFVTSLEGLFGWKGEEWG